MVVDIFELGIKELKAAKEADANTPLVTERSLDVLVCGSIQCGKSTFISRFLNQNPTNERTIGLSYKFASRTRVAGRELANIWELGNGGLTAAVIKVCLNERNIRNFSVVLFIDMTHPESFEATLRPLMDTLRLQIDALRKQAVGSNVFAVALNPPDGCFAIGVPMTVIGAKYDEFQNFDTERKRNIIRLLRFFAHINGSSLQMYSIAMEPLTQRGRSILNQCAFDSAPQAAAPSTDIHKPVSVAAFTDSLEDIGALTKSGVIRPPMTSNSEAMEIFFAAANEMFPQEADKQQPTVNVDEEAKQFAEPMLDAAIEQRYRELEFQLRENRH